MTEQLNPTELAARLESHMGKQDVHVLLADCRKAAGTIRAQAARIAALREALLMHNDALRSACSIADRNGEETNWRAFRGQCRFTLAEYHELVNEARAALKGTSDDGP